MSQDGLGVEECFEAKAKLMAAVGFVASVAY
jgi:hypothetical protein